MNVQAKLPASDVYEKAVALYEKGKWDAAKEHFHEYLAEYSETPLYVTCLYYLGVCYEQLKEPQKAIAIFHKVVDMSLGSDEFWGEMAEKKLLALTSQGAGS